MEKLIRYCIGIDVDKKTFKAHFASMDGTAHLKTIASRTFANNPKGFTECEGWIAKNRKNPSAWLAITMEATGVYHENLAWHFHGKGFHINIVLALKAKRYLQSLGLRSKNDQIDAQGLATMGLQQQLDRWNPISTDLLKLRSLTRQYESFQIAKTTFSNQMEAVTYSAVSDPLVAKSLKSVLKKMDAELQAIENQIYQTIKDNNTLAAKWALLEPIKGLGMRTFAVVVAETGGFALFKNIKQLTCYAGYDVVENQSGNRVGNTRISKKGNAHIRRAMFMPAFGVVKHEKGVFQDLFERVFDRTKIKMKGYVAVQRKLLCLIYTLWKKDEKYVAQKPQGHSKKEEPESPLSGTVATATEPNQEAQKVSSPAINSRATLDRLSGKCSPSSPLSGNTKILEKSYH